MANGHERPQNEVLAECEGLAQRIRRLPPMRRAAYSAQRAAWERARLRPEGRRIVKSMGYTGPDPNFYEDMEETWQISKPGGIRIRQAT